MCKQLNVHSYFYAILLVGLSSVALIAQDTKEPAGSVEEPSAAASKGRLPPYYKDVVDAKQKEEIYSIQASYADKIAKVQEEVKRLISERDAAVEKVLTTAQREKLAKVREEAYAKRKGTGFSPAKKAEKAMAAEDASK